MKRPAVPIAVAAAIAACLIAAGASAQPVLSGRSTPHFLAKRGTVPPTTQDCLDAFGVSCYSPLQLERPTTCRRSTAPASTGAARRS